jgi:hypothetical protein
VDNEQLATYGCLQKEQGLPTTKGCEGQQEHVDVMVGATKRVSLATMQSLLF